jgi:hypothetical protein
MKSERVGGLILSIAHVRNRRFGNGERQVFNRRCKAAGLDDLLKDWSNKADALRHNVKPGVTKERRRLEVEVEEAAAYERLADALDSTAHRRIEDNTEEARDLLREALPLLREALPLIQTSAEQTKHTHRSLWRVSRLWVYTAMRMASPWTPTTPRR